MGGWRTVAEEIDRSVKPLRRGVGFDDRERRLFAGTPAKRFPPYVYSTRGGSLIHKVAGMRLRWYTCDLTHLWRLKRPTVIVDTVCGQFLFIESWRAKTCAVPAADALRCGRCHGERATFSKDGAARKAGITRRIARQRLGCMPEGL